MVESVRYGYVLNAAELRDWTHWNRGLHVHGVASVQHVVRRTLGALGGRPLLDFNTDASCRPPQPTTKPQSAPEARNRSTQQTAAERMPSSTWIPTPTWTGLT